MTSAIAQALLGLGLAGCVARAPLAFEVPARAPEGAEGCIAAPGAVAGPFAQGVRLSDQETAGLFPELGLEVDLVRHARLQARAEVCGTSVVLRDLVLSLHGPGGQHLPVGLATDVLAGPGVLRSLRREEPDLRDGWRAADRVTLVRPGPVVVGAVKPDR